jgi:hypothetical protein
VAHIPAKHPTASKRTESQKQLQVIEGDEVVQPGAPVGDSVQHTSMGRGGLERPPISPRITPNPESRGSKSGNITPAATLTTLNPRISHDLETVVAAWDDLPPVIRAAIMALVDVTER